MGCVKSIPLFLFNNKYIIQYGTLASSVTFPIAYKSKWCICDGMVRSGGAGGNSYQFTSVTKTGFGHAFDSGQSGYYIVIGY